MNTLLMGIMNCSSEEISFQTLQLIDSLF